MLATYGLNLSKVYGRPIFQSRSAVKTHKELSGAISKHGLTWGKGNVNTKLFRCDLNRISVMSLGYGAEVEIHAAGFNDFSLVQMPLRGAAEFVSDGVALTAVPGDIAILTPKTSVQTLWQADCEQLILKVPHCLIGPLTLDLDIGKVPSSVSRSIRLSPAYKINPAVTQQWKSLLQYLLSLPTSDESTLLNPNWLLHFEKNIALFLISHQPQSEADNEFIELSKTTASKIGFRKNIVMTRLTQLEDYVQSCKSSTLSLMDLAAAAGVSVRTLNLLCHRHFGLSPMIWLRNTRLDAAREKLLASHETSVTEVALACGFEHLGRFSAYYYDRFGEQPRKTSGRLIKKVTCSESFNE